MFCHDGQRVPFSTAEWQQRHKNWIELNILEYIRNEWCIWVWVWTGKDYKGPCMALCINLKADYFLSNGPLCGSTDILCCVIPLGANVNWFWVKIQLQSVLQCYMEWVTQRWHNRLLQGNNSPPSLLQMCSFNHQRICCRFSSYQFLTNFYSSISTLYAHTHKFPVLHS